MARLARLSGWLLVLIAVAVATDHHGRERRHVEATNDGGELERRAASRARIAGALDNLAALLPMATGEGESGGDEPLKETLAFERMNLDHRSVDGNADVNGVATGNYGGIEATELFEYRDLDDSSTEDYTGPFVILPTDGDAEVWFDAHDDYNANMREKCVTLKTKVQVLFSFGTRSDAQSSLAYAGFKRVNMMAQALAENSATYLKVPVSATAPSFYLDKTVLPYFPGNYFLPDGSGKITPARNRSWKEYYQAAMGGTKVMIFLLNEAWLSSDNCWEEAAWASGQTTTGYNGRVLNGGGRRYLEEGTPVLVVLLDVAAQDAWTTGKMHAEAKKSFNLASNGKLKDYFDKHFDGKYYEALDFAAKYGTGAQAALKMTGHGLDDAVANEMPNEDDEMSLFKELLNEVKLYAMKLYHAADIKIFIDQVIGI